MKFASAVVLLLSLTSTVTAEPLSDRFQIVSASTGAVLVDMLLDEMHEGISIPFESPLATGAVFFREPGAGRLSDVLFESSNNFSFFSDLDGAVLDPPGLPLGILVTSLEETGALQDVTTELFGTSPVSFRVFVQSDVAGLPEPSTLMLLIFGFLSLWRVKNGAHVSSGYK
jgi:hypothetical protein